MSFVAVYGTEQKSRDVTDAVLTHFYVANKQVVRIEKGTVLNHYFGDPVPNVRKTLTIAVHKHDRVLKIPESVTETRCFHIDNSTCNCEKLLQKCEKVARLLTSGNKIDLLQFINTHEQLVDSCLEFEQSKLVVKHTAGFFSCCSVLLEKLTQHCFDNKKHPRVLQTTHLFDYYKPIGQPGDIMKQFFVQPDKLSLTPVNITEPFSHKLQFADYRTLNFSLTNQFIGQYFTPSLRVKSIVRALEQKYRLNYENLCVLFYRGNDKKREAKLAPHSDFVERGKITLQQDPKTKFLVQSDETEFIEAMIQEFGKERCIVFRDEIRHMSHRNDTVDKVFPRADNFKFALNFLAITLIMSRANSLIIPNGNCSLWICLFRGNAEKTQQYLEGKWIS